MRTSLGSFGEVSKPGTAVFVSGVVSMGLEILAGRMVAPQFGSSIYTWGTIIGVFLAALSLGYYQGGKRAAARASERRLVTVLLWTTGFVVALVFAGDLLLAGLAGFPVPPRFASLPAVTVLFGPPTYLLGFISPYGAELSDREGTGAASGHVYAVGTVGSIVGAFGTTYLLIPSLSIDLIGLAFGLLLVVTTLYVLAPAFPRRETGASLVLALLLVGAVVAPSAGYSVRGEVVHATQTDYQELVVADLGETRTLYLDGQPHSAMDKSDPTAHVFEYTRYFHLPLLWTDARETADGTVRPDVDRVLFIGGGGFTGPKRFAAEYDATVDVVELDPAVVAAAEEYFAIEDVEDSEDITVHTTDGRQFLRETNHTYDVIVLDAYRKDKVPFHLTTVEFMELASDRLDDDGVFMANLISAPTGPAAQFYRAEYRTLEAVFPQVYGFPTTGGTVVQNIEVVATNSDQRLSQAQLRERNERRNLGIDLGSELDSYQGEVETGDAPVLRDDDAPVDALLEPLVGQRYVVEGAGDDETAPSAARTGTATPG